MDKSLIGLVVFIAAYIAARAINERALKELIEAEKARLIDGFSSYRIFTLVIVVVLVGLHFVSSAFNPNSYFSTFPAFAVVLVVYSIAVSLYAFRKLKILKIPDGYINQFLLSTFIKFIGIFIFFGFLLNRDQ